MSGRFKKNYLSHVWLPPHVRISFGALLLGWGSHLSHHRARYTLCLLDLDNCEDNNKISAFSLINAPSAVSSLGSTQGALARAAASAQGTPTVPVSSMPVCTFAQSQGGGVGGVGGVGVSPSTKASTKGIENSLSSFVPKNTKSPQVCCIFINEFVVSSSTKTRSRHCV